ncbi:S8 family peptidase [Actinoplanes ianthinogenes]|nr:S8 family peptidase [Actinoplanes ianthinogenes]
MRRTALAGLVTAVGVLGVPAAPVLAAPAEPTRMVSTVLDPDGRPVITVHQVSGPHTLGLEVDGIVRALEAPTGTDTYRSRQWDLTRMNVPTAWQRSTGTGVTVAVIDTGVDASHPDLAGQVLTGYDATTDQDGGTTDPQGHGTHVAGTVAALAGNGIGVAGVAPDVKILPVRVLDAKGVGYDSDTAQGIVWAADHGADVINMSLGGTDRSSAVSSAVAYARSKGVVVVAAAGNERQKGSPTSYPGADPGVIAVAATDSADQVASYSNAGDYVDVAAPGSSIISTYPTGLAAAGYATMNGTSMASPHVAAVAALLLAAKPGLTPDEVESALEGSAVDLGAAGKDNDFGYGRVDAAAALDKVVPVTPVPVTPAPVTPAPVVKVTSNVTSRVVAYGTRTSTVFQVSPASAQPVGVCTSVGGAAWSCTPATTSSTGAYTVARTATASFRVRLTAGTASATSTYTVKAVVAVSRTATKTLTVKVTGVAGQKLTVQRYVNKRWSTVKTYSATSSRKVTGLVGGGSYRVVLASTSKVAGVTSKTVKA